MAPPPSAPAPQARAAHPDSEPPTADGGTQDGRALHEGFRAFVEASRRLEQSHAALQRRAAAIDLQLAATNRALESALAEKEAILSALPVGVLATGDDGATLWSNPEGSRLARVLARAGVSLARLPDGESQHGALSVATRRAPLPDGRTLLVLEDRSDLVRLGEEVDRLDRLAGLTELALGIAHEIKNPLNGAMGFAALMERTHDVADLQRQAGLVRAGLAQVDEIVREMLAFALAPAASHARAPLASVIAHAAAAAGIPRRCIALAGGAEIDVEPAALTRVLANLFRNSAEAAGAGVAISVDARRHADRVELRVRDDGPGVPAELGARVFEPFVSSKSSPTAASRDRGRGLGLALASRVIAFLGGALTLENPGQRGAEFRVTLPSSPKPSPPPCPPNAPS